MNKALVCAKLIVKKSTVSGYGVFSAQDIQKGEIIEESYTLEVRKQETDLNDYYFACPGTAPATEKKSLLPLGYGCIYNHSTRPNAKFAYDKLRKVLVFTAAQPIKRGEEIFVSYGNHWFSRRTIEYKHPPLWYRIHKVLFVSLRFIAVCGTIALLLYELDRLSMVPLQLF